MTKKRRMPERILTALRGKPASRQMLQDALHASQSGVKNTLTALRVAGRVHILRWEDDKKGRCNTPVYAIGAGKDATARAPSRSKAALKPPPPPPPPPRKSKRRHATIDLTTAKFRSVFVGGANPWACGTVQH